MAPVAEWLATSLRDSEGPEARKLLISTFEAFYFDCDLSVCDLPSFSTCERLGECGSVGTLTNACVLGLGSECLLGLMKRSSCFKKHFKVLLEAVTRKWVSETPNRIDSCR